MLTSLTYQVYPLSISYDRLQESEISLPNILIVCSCRFMVSSGIYFDHQYQQCLCSPQSVAPNHSRSCQHLEQFKAAEESYSIASELKTSILRYKSFKWDT